MDKKETHIRKNNNKKVWTPNTIHMKIGENSAGKKCKKKIPMSIIDNQYVYGPLGTGFIRRPSQYCEDAG